MRTGTSIILKHMGAMIRSVSQAIMSKHRTHRTSALPQYGPRSAVSLLLALFAFGSFTPPNHILSRIGKVSAFSEAITTFASDCTTPKVSWDLGGTACAVATAAPGDRRIAWVAPNGAIARVSGFISGTASDSYSIPTGSHPFAQVGTWAVETIDVNGVAFSSAEFVVRDPANASVNLSIGNFGPFQASPGSNISYQVEAINRGPDSAQSVVLTSPVPADTTFVSAIQNSGSVFTCTVPQVGSGSGTISCTLASLPPNSTAIFTFAFSIDGGLANGANITSTASISSATNEMHEPDNTASSSTTIVAGTPSCTVNCPTVPPVTTSQCNAAVTYAAPTTSGSCGAGSEGGGGVVCSPPSGSAFPVGSTTVTCTAPTGDACEFTVTVQSTGQSNPLTISCPVNVTVNSDNLSAGTAPVSYPAPTVTGNCVTVSCVPPSGSAFSLGTTVVTCTATDSSGSTTCSFNVTVNDSSPGACTIVCPGDVNQTAGAGLCSAVVSYSSPTTSGDCGTVTCNPASGSTFNVGSTVVTCTSTAGADCEFTVTVLPPSAPVITTCATNKTISANGACVAAIPNLVGEVVVTGCSANVSQSPTAGTLVGAGTVTVTITAENAAGQVACTATVTVTGVDPTPPQIICPPGSSVTIDENCQGSVPDVIDSVVAMDNCTDPDELTVTQNPAAGTLVGVGTTTITVTVRDGSNNTATCTTTFTVTETTPPTITCPANVVVYLPLDSTATSMVVNYPAVTATDNCPGVTVASVPASGSVFPVGPTTINATATDAANNSSTCSFTVTVLYNFTGFFSPVGNPPILNTVNAGRAIPVKFSLSGDKGLNILAVGFPASGIIPCDANAPPVEVTETETAGSSSLSFVNNQYVYLWKTEASWAGTCRQLVVKLNDGSVHVANFKFR